MGPSVPRGNGSAHATDRRIAQPSTVSGGHPGIRRPHRAATDGPDLAGLRRGTPWPGRCPDPGGRHGLPCGRIADRGTPPAPGRTRVINGTPHRSAGKPIGISRSNARRGRATVPPGAERDAQRAPAGCRPRMACIKDGAQNPAERSPWPPAPGTHASRLAKGP